MVEQQFLLTEEPHRILIYGTIQPQRQVLQG